MKNAGRITRAYAILDKTPGEEENMGLLSKIRRGLERSAAYFSDEKGQTLVEYGLLAVLIAVVVYLMLAGFGQTENSVYSKINSFAGLMSGQ
jgi:Flp pilus assembly pilin Flp